MVRSSNLNVGGIKLINKKERVQCTWKQDLLTTSTAYNRKHKKHLHFFSSLRGPHEQPKSLHAFAIFATPWVPWQCEVLRNCAKDFWMPRSYAMGHALLDPHDASVFDYCIRNVLMWGEVLDNDSAFERQHGNQSETNRQPSIQIYPQLRSADFNPFNDLEYPWNSFFKTSTIPNTSLHHENWGEFF